MASISSNNFVRAGPGTAKPGRWRRAASSAGFAACTTEPLLLGELLGQRAGSGLTRRAARHAPLHRRAPGRAARQRVRLHGNRRIGLPVLRAATSDWTLIGTGGCPGLEHLDEASGERAACRIGVVVGEHDQQVPVIDLAVLLVSTSGTISSWISRAARRVDRQLGAAEPRRGCGSVRRSRRRRRCRPSPPRGRRTSDRRHDAGGLKPRRTLTGVAGEGRGDRRRGRRRIPSLPPRFALNASGAHW